MFLNIVMRFKTLLFIKYSTKLTRHTWIHVLFFKHIMNRKEFLKWYDHETRMFLKQQSTVKENLVVNFCGFSLTIFPKVWNPTWGLSSKIIADTMEINTGDDVLEIGTGSGALAILASNRGANSVFGVDKSLVAVKCARKNVLINKVESSVQIKKSDLFSSLKQHKFDVILFNPPQRTLNSKSLLGLACFDDKMTTIKKFISNAKRFLKNDGVIYLGYGNAGEIDTLESLMLKSGWNFKVMKKMVLGPKIYRVYRLNLK